MNRIDSLSYLGSMQQLAFIRPIIYQDGRSTDLRAFQVKNGDIQFTAMAGKCLDIADFSYKGININFLSKPGLVGRNHYDTNGQEALRSIMGGLFFTCGLENICAPCNDNGKEYPMHGRLRSSPAEHLSSDAFWKDDAYHLRISGEIREAELFGENMVLRRSIETVLGEAKVKISDTYVNQAFRPEPMMLMYHFNLGYPLLSEDSVLILPSKKVYPRDEISELGLDKWSQIEKPQHNKTENVFIHEIAYDSDGWSFAILWNPSLSIGFKLSFNNVNLPYFYQWKSMASGDYVLGLEPANSSVYGRLKHVEENSLHMLDPFEEEQIEIIIEMIDDKKDFEYWANAANKLCEVN